MCWRSLNLQEAAYRYFRWSVVVFAVIAVTLQLLSLFGAAAAKIHMPPPFLGTLVFHLTATAIFASIYWKKPKLRHRKLVALTCCFALAFCFDVAFLTWWLFLGGGFHAYTTLQGRYLCLVRKSFIPYCLDLP